jgi:hypothetical protein
VQNNMQRPLGAHEFAIHFHVVALRRLRAEIRAALSVDGDSTFRDQLIAMPARTNAGRCEETIQAHRRARKTMDSASDSTPNYFKRPAWF